MKPLKIRVWDNFRKLLIEPELILGVRFDRRTQEPLLITYTNKKFSPSKELSELDKVYCNEFEIIFFTGFKDIRDKDVYTGDFLYDTFAEELYVVIFRDGAFMAEGTDEIELLSEIIGECEVYSNIYEKPELLEGD